MEVKCYILVVLTLGCLSLAGSRDVEAQDASAVPNDPRWTMLGDYCEKCHNATDWAGGIAYDTMTPQDIATDAKIWEAAVRKLRGRMMPPPGEKQPDQATIDSFVAKMEHDLDAAGAAQPDPGEVALHRLNRTEYARAVEDLLGLKIDATALLPKDVKSDGFDNVANVLTVSPTFLDQYITAARQVAVQAVGNPAAKRMSRSYRASGANQSLHIEGLPLGTRGGMVIEHEFPADGEYEINLDVFISLSSNLGYIGGLDQEHKIVVTLDDAKIFEGQLGGAADLKIADQQSVQGVKEIRGRFQHIRATVTAGPHKIGATFIARTFAESDATLESFIPSAGMDRIPALGGLEVVGPSNPTGVADTPSRQRIFVCRPAHESDELPCAQRIVAELARHAFRRPVDDGDLAAPLRFYEMGRKGGNFDTGIETALVAILASPKFLYRAETVPADLAPGAAYRISDIELASRLSFFLWSRGPDEELLHIAEQNRLHDPQVLDAQVQRMLADERSKSLVTNFAFQWLQVDSINGVDPDPSVYPNFDEDLRKAFRREIELFVDSILRQDRSVPELMTANYTFVNERLALHYGIANVRGSAFRRVTLADSSRWGLLGKGSVLMGTSYGNRTAPVLRGAWILENITGTPPKAPPPGVEALKENVPGGTALTVRERMVQHRTQPSCNACHGIMDPLGLALENFDAIGKWQIKDRDSGTPIDSTGQLVNGTPLYGPSDLRKALIARPEQFVQTMTEKLMVFALGRSMEYRDMPAIRAIVRNAASENYRFFCLVKGIVNSEPFQMRRIPQAQDGDSGKQVTARNSPR